MSKLLLPPQVIEQIKIQILTRAREENPLGMLTHIPEVVRWSTVVLKDHPEADSNVSIAGAWLHDCGWLWPDPDIEDHAISGEKVARAILSKLEINEQIIMRITRIVRTHRNRPDNPPSTIEEKIVAAADSAAHFTDGCYEAMTSDKAMAPRGTRKTAAMGKLERDWRDVHIFPKLLAQLQPTYTEIKTRINALSNNF